MKYPIQITEVPHRGKRREWTLYDEKHLQECVEQAYSHGYDGDGSLDNYLEWVGHDLSECHITAEKEYKMTKLEQDVLTGMIESVRQAIATTGASGIPSGHLYSMMMGFGCSKEVYDHLINVLLETGKITKDGFHVLRAT